LDLPGHPTSPPWRERLDFYERVLTGQALSDDYVVRADEKPSTAISGGHSD
jgi:hypothetical protein